MADRPENRDLETPDALAAVVAQQDVPAPPPPRTPEVPLQPSDKSDSAESHSVDNEKSHHPAPSESHDDGEELAPTRTNATDASVGTMATQVEQKEKTWKQKLNPLRWGKIPEIPKEPIISREYGASIFSQVFFNWMTPLMTVRFCASASGRCKTCVNKNANLCVDGIQETAARARSLVCKS